MKSEKLDQLIRNNPEDVKTFNKIFDELFAPLCYFSERLLNSKEEAREITLNAFTKFWKIRHNFESFQNVKAFLYITTRNKCLDVLKFQKRETERVRKYGLWNEFTGENQELYETEANVLKTIIEEIENLPPKYRTVLRLHYFDDLSTNEIAELLRMNPRSVRKIREAGLEKLRVIILKRGHFTIVIFFFVLLD